MSDLTCRSGEDVVFDVATRTWDCRSTVISTSPRTTRSSGEFAVDITADEPWTFFNAHGMRHLHEDVDLHGNPVKTGSTVLPFSLAGGNAVLIRTYLLSLSNWGTTDLGGPLGSPYDALSITDLVAGVRAGRPHFPDGPDGWYLLTPAIPGPVRLTVTEADPLFDSLGLWQDYQAKGTRRELTLVAEEGDKGLAALTLTFAQCAPLSWTGDIEPNNLLGDVFEVETLVIECTLSSYSNTHRPTMTAWVNDMLLGAKANNRLALHVGILLSPFGEVSGFTYENAFLERYTFPAFFPRISGQDSSLLETFTFGANRLTVTGGF